MHCKLSVVWEKVLVVRCLMVSTIIIVVVVTNPAKLVLYCRWIVFFIMYGNYSVEQTGHWLSAIYCSAKSIIVSANSLNSCIYWTQKTLMIYFRYQLGRCCLDWSCFICLDHVTMLLHYVGSICFHQRWRLFFCLCGDISCFGRINPLRLPRIFDLIPLW